MHQIIKFRKESGTLLPHNPLDQARLDAYLRLLPDNAQVEVYMEAIEPDGTLAQLAKVHAMIKQLALHTGTTFQEMKMVIKEQAGLCLTRDSDGLCECRSFGDCSRQELSLIIQTCVQSGELFGMALH